MEYPMPELNSQCQKFWTIINCTMIGILVVTSFPWGADSPCFRFPSEGGSFYCKGGHICKEAMWPMAPVPYLQGSFLGRNRPISSVRLEQKLSCIRDHFWKGLASMADFLFLLLWEAWFGHTSLRLERWVYEAHLVTKLKHALQSAPSVPELIIRPSSVWLLSYSSAGSQLRKQKGTTYYLYSPSSK